MHDRAFNVLGIEPSFDQHVLRAAYVRLARIYHPDRFVGMPDDVRAEAARRMKEVSAAYEELRAVKRAAAAAASSRTNARTASKRAKDPWEEARRAREAVATRRAEQARSRERWLLWEELERQARERADLEAQLATVLDEDPNAFRKRKTDPAADEPFADSRSSLASRLEEARGARGRSATELRKSF